MDNHSGDFQTERIDVDGLDPFSATANVFAGSASQKSTLSEIGFTVSGTAHGWVSGELHREEASGTSWFEAVFTINEAVPYALTASTNTDTSHLSFIGPSTDIDFDGQFNVDMEGFLEPGEYTFSAHVSANGSVSNTRFDIEFAVIPAPSALLLVLLGAARARRRRQVGLSERPAR